MNQLKDYLFYQDDWATIYCGDCLEIMPLMESDSVDLVLTDPPYNVGLEYDGKTDWMTFEAYEQWCSNWFYQLEAKRKERGKIIIFPGHGNLDMWFRIRRPHGIACWFKPGSPRHGGIFQWCEWEPFLVYDPSCKAIGGSDVFRSSQFNQCDTENHPCPKPFNLFLEILTRIKPDLVFDPFLGSGTTCLASKNLNRKSIGIEINPRYCEISVRRLRQEVFDFRKEVEKI